MNSGTAFGQGSLFLLIITKHSINIGLGHLRRQKLIPNLNEIQTTLSIRVIPGTLPICL